jgi:uncharacterized protein (DUF488 family)
MTPSTIFTIGHSSRSIGQLTGLLDAVGVRELIDVRNMPRSLRHPHFSAERLAGSLATRGIAYEHEQALGEFHPPRWRSANRAWSRPALRGYADFMTSDRFRVTLERLQRRARERAVCLMCAETHWRRCHRRLICDALLVRGWRVLHLGLGPQPVLHELTPFAVVTPERTIVYPALELQAS